MVGGCCSRWCGWTSERQRARAMGTAGASVGEIKVEGFSAHMENRGGAIVVWLRGNADMEVHERLKGFLDALGAAAKLARPQEIVFELEELYFMNSSCLSLILRFVNGALELKASHQYKARFRSNPNLRWQKKSLDAIHAYAKELVIIE
jgi:anti-anti-sigma factor